MFLGVVVVCFLVCVWLFVRSIACLLVFLSVCLCFVLVHGGVFLCVMRLFYFINMCLFVYLFVCPIACLLITGFLCSYVSASLFACVALLLLPLLCLCLCRL